MATIRPIWPNYELFLPACSIQILGVVKERLNSICRITFFSKHRTPEEITDFVGSILGSQSAYKHSKEVPQGLFPPR